jgi:NitT/TauT family transport system permease protein
MPNELLKKVLKVSSYLYFLIFLVLWEVLFQLNLLSKSFFSSPSSILEKFGSRDFWSIFLIDSLQTLSLVWSSLIVGVLLSYFLLFISTFNKEVYKILQQFNRLIAYFPIPALIPISILFFGVGDSAKSFLVIIAALIIYLNFLIEITKNEEGKFITQQQNWSISPWQRFKHFLLPLSLNLNYRIIINLIVWTFSLALISEMVFGGETGWGNRLLQFQQLYNTPMLYAYLVLIILICFILEKILIAVFARSQWDWVKKYASIVLIIASISAFSYNFRSLNFNEVKGDKITIATYQSGVNLPLFVMQEKFNNPDFQFITVNSGIQAVDSLQSDKVLVGGYSDEPNALSAASANDNLKIISEVVESPDHPSIFLISKRKTAIGDYKDLNNTKINYFPNNPIIKNGLNFTFLAGGVDTTTVTYNSSNDPNSLVQGFNSGSSETFVGIEPSINKIENNCGCLRTNAKETLLKSFPFKNLPLGSLLINQSKLNKNQKKILSESLNQSIDYISQNTNSDHKANKELQEILRKYDLGTQMSISKYNKTEEFDPIETRQIGQFINIFEGEKKVPEEIDLVKNLYYKMD